MTKDFLISAFRRVQLRMQSRHDPGYSDYPDEDSLQDAFCRLWSRREQITGQSEAEGFLSVTARNIKIDHARHRTAFPEVGLAEMTREPAYSSDLSDEKKQLLIDVESLMKRELSERDQEILYRRERDGWEFDELAEYYGLTESNVRIIVSRSRKKIRELYRKRKE
ncbi:MAG: sigma-70 family RNA polymerase sigma factor [Muribaculaceae bacterium]|nr:sigma-70 family RNA polymerase sigma factor [Muribaculaceae bacterium]